MSGAAKNTWHAFDACTKRLELIEPAPVVQFIDTGILKGSRFVLCENPLREKRFWRSEYGIVKLANHRNPMLHGWPCNFSISDALVYAPGLKVRIEEVAPLDAVHGVEANGKLTRITVRVIGIMGVHDLTYDEFMATFGGEDLTQVGPCNVTH